MRDKAVYPTEGALRTAIKAARGEIRADLVIKNAHLLDVFSGAFVTGDLAVAQGQIVGVIDSYEGVQVIDAAGAYLVPGFIDAHVHIESSMMTPARFQQAVLPCGTTTVFWDPHEIANVKGRDGIKWALAASEGLDLDVFVMIPSCVPSTTPELGLETSGAVLRSKDLLEFRGHERVLGLAEMMNFPGLLMGDQEVLEKLQAYAAKKRDGHCPGLSGKDLNAYGVAGIHSCHESTTRAEAAEKMTKGIHVLIREGSCAKDADVLLPLINAYTSSVLSLCSDDRNPADIAAEGHINCIIDKGLRAGHRPEDVFRTASFAPARIYGLDDRGALAPGYLADFCLVKPKDGKDFKSGLEIHSVYKRGILVDAQTLKTQAASRGDQDSLKGGQNRSNLNMDAVQPSHLILKSVAASTQACRVIGVRPGQIITDQIQADIPVKGGHLCADPRQDILKIAVFERHHRSGGFAVGLVHGFGLNGGAIATSINHDSHNVIVVGSSDEIMAAAVNALRVIDGGIVVLAETGEQVSLPLPIGGLMTAEDPSVVTEALHKLKSLTQKLGCKLNEPFLQLSFLALPVIPNLKITDKGLVDVNGFKLVSVGVAP